MLASLEINGVLEFSPLLVEGVGMGRAFLPQRCQDGAAGTRFDQVIDLRRVGFQVEAQFETGARLANPPPLAVSTSARRVVREKTRGSRRRVTQ
jgi:hypothetical protein